jgi:hypothetical protein
MTDFHLIVQLTVGVVFLLSAVGKLRNPRAFAFGIEDYEILPDRLASSAAVLIIVFESWVAIAHITGKGLRLAVPVAFGLLASFAIAVAVNLRRGRVLSCYCFDAGGGKSISRLTLFRLLLLISTEIFLFASPSKGWISMQSHNAAAIGLTFCWVTFVLVASSWLLSLPDLADLLRGSPKGPVLVAGTRSRLNRLQDQAFSEARRTPGSLSS